LETDRILALYPDRRLDYFAGAHWTSTVDDVVQEVYVTVYRKLSQFEGRCAVKTWVCCSADRADHWPWRTSPI